jgi:hypothetical protein
MTTAYPVTPTSFSCACLRILASVPGLISSPSLPATVTRPGLMLAPLQAVDSDVVA